MKKVLFIFGTRPEAIKMAPLIIELMKHDDFFIVGVCLTAQHREMLDQVTGFFDISADFDLNLMRNNQTLFDITAEGIRGLAGVFDAFRPDLVVVQGDTTTTFIGALAAYYRQVKVAHLEAGLRSGHRYSPFPEEMNRTLTSRLTDFHFPPTERAREYLAAEGIRDKVWVVGNTVIDALLLGLQIINEKGDDRFRSRFEAIDFSKRIILVTGHRRESFGEPFERMCRAMREITDIHPDCRIVYPVHLNPNVRQPVGRILSGCERVSLIEPLDYPELIWLMEKSYLVLTDSGGIQEEAPTLGKPVLVMREVTERQEGIEAGTARLVGTNTSVIVENVSQLLTDSGAYERMAKAVNPYGDGTTSRKIAEILKNELR